MKSFSQIFRESANPNLPPNFKAPSPKATFQLNDIVLVRSDSLTQFKAHNPQKNAKYYNTIGTVIGYKPGTMSAKYAIEFADGSVAIFNTAYLVGPFASKEAANKATQFKTNISIPPELFLKYVKRDVSIPVNSEIEDQFKKIFVADSTYDFKWLENPIVLSGNPTHKAKLKLVILAYRENKEESLVYYDPERTTVLSGFEPCPQFSNRFIFFKIFDDLKGECAPVPGVESWHRNPEWPKGNTGYYLMIPRLPDSLYILNSLRERTDLDNFTPSAFQHTIQKTTIGLSKTFFKQTEKSVKSEFLNVERLKHIKSFEEYFDLIFSAESQSDGTKLISKTHFSMELSDLPSDFDLSKYKIQGDCSIVLDGSRKNVKQPINVPKSVAGNFSLCFDSLKLRNLKGLPETIGGNLLLTRCELDSLEYCPEKINGDFTISGRIKNLQFCPKRISKDFTINGDFDSFEGGDDCVIGGRFYASRDKSVKNLKGLPKARNYDITGVTHKQIKEYFAVKAIEDEFPEMQGVF